MRTQVEPGFATHDEKNEYYNYITRAMIFFGLKNEYEVLNFVDMPRRNINVSFEDENGVVLDTLEIIRQTTLYGVLHDIHQYLHMHYTVNIKTVFIDDFSMKIICTVRDIPDEVND
jgi:hypothetical protein